MKRKYTVLTAVLAATAVLMAGTWLLSARQSGSDTLETVLAASVSGNVTGISYNTAEEQLRFVLREEQWFWEDDSEFPLSQGYAQTMTSLLQNVTATELVTENCPDFTEYGLEKPKKTITAETDEGETVTLYLGDQNTHTKDYYMRIGDENALYTVDSTFYDSFNHDLYSMAAYEEWPAASAESVTSMQLESADASFLISRREETTSEDDSSVTEIYTYTDADESFDTEDITAASLLNDASSVSFTGLAAFRPDASAVASYGLETPSATLTVTYLTASGAEETCTLQIGTKSESGDYPVRIENSNCVYWMDGDLVDEFLTFSSDLLLVY